MNVFQTFTDRVNDREIKINERIARVSAHIVHFWLNYTALEFSAFCFDLMLF